MGKIFYLMGKSASGKDTLYQCLKEELHLPTVVLYTTRPIREGEQDGREYHFVKEEQFRQFVASGKVIESRTYQTVHGPWTYFTVDDGQVQLEKDSYLVIGTLESFVQMQKYYGQSAVVPLYIHVDDGVRLARALERERQQAEPKYAEMCRRFLADEEDFSEQRLMEAGICQCYENQNKDECLVRLREAIKRYQTV